MDPAGQKYAEALPHGPLREVLSDVYVVTGSFVKAGVLRFSRNMTVVRDGDDLTLINAVRLDETGLAALEELGTVRHVVKLGFYHGIDDPFYVARYGAKLWALPRHEHEAGLTTDVALGEDEPLPFGSASLFVYRTAVKPEAVVHLQRHGGVLIACDSLQNWFDTSEYFNLPAKLVLRLFGFLRPANIPAAWRKDARPAAEDFRRLESLEFHHMLSAHGPPLLDTAHEDLGRRIRELYGV